MIVGTTRHLLRSEPPMFANRYTHTDGRQATQVAIAVNTLNRMLALGRPASIRVA